MRVISKPVGKNQANVKSDVAVVQRLLNEKIGYLTPIKLLRVNGMFTPIMDGSIVAFQTRVVKLASPDGCVQPQGPTFDALAHGPVEAKPPGGKATATTSTAAQNHYPANVEAFVTMALPVAQDVRRKWQVPASVVIAQSALESGWGAHVVQNAYFGIKGRAPSGDSTTFGTTEVVAGQVIHIDDTFRAYTSYADAADDYGRFLSENERYRTAFDHRDDPIQFVLAVAEAGYATDPSYAKSLSLIIRAYDLHQYDG